MNIYGLIVILLFLGQAIVRGEKLQMSQNADFHFAICRFRKIQIFISFRKLQ